MIPEEGLKDSLIFYFVWLSALLTLCLPQYQSLFFPDCFHPLGVKHELDKI